MFLSRDSILKAILVTLLFALDVVSQESITITPGTSPDTVRPAVVQLLAIGPGGMGQNQECSATGFVVNEEGYILTNAHVVEKAEECLAHSPGAKILAKPDVTVDTHSKVPQTGGVPSAGLTAPAVECDVVAEDQVHDLAVLKPVRAFHSGASNGAAPFVTLDAAGIPSGTRVKVTGHPAFAFVPLTESAEIIGRKSLTLYENATEQTEVLVLNTPLKHGNSGSPVYQEANGAVVGIVERRNTSNTQQSLAVPIRYAIDFMNRLGVKWHGQP